jgi:enoyl-CoA hydratase/carnithine racemase
VSSKVRYGVDGSGVATIALDDPLTRNALGDDLLDELTARLQDARDDDRVRVVVLTSADDRVFSSGGNLKAFTDDRSAVQKYQGFDRFPRLFQLIGSLGKPSVCAANGDVLAGAFGLALACDLIVARAGIRLGCPEITVGVFPFMISPLVLRSMPRAVANELLLTGRLMSAEEAYALHVVNAVAPAGELAATVGRLTDTLASASPLLMKMGKEALHATTDLSLPQAFAYLQGQLALAATTDDLHEGILAFREKRTPQWTGG